jgi:hypothetical protein
VEGAVKLALICFAAAIVGGWLTVTEWNDRRRHVGFFSKRSIAAGTRGSKTLRALHLLDANFRLASLAFATIVSFAIAVVQFSRG